ASLAEYRKALAVHQELAARPGAGPETVLDVARCLLAVGHAQTLSGDYAGSLATLEEARDVVEQLENSSVQSASSRAVKGRAYRATGLVLRNLGKRAEALEANEKAVAILQLVVKDHSTDHPYFEFLMDTQQQIGHHLIEEGQWARGMAELLKAH